jgi:hypothetical protein
MIAIEKEFGGVHLGFETEDSKIRKKPEKETNPYWFKIYEVLSYGPKRMNAFKALID